MSFSVSKFLAVILAVTTATPTALVQKVGALKLNLHTIKADVDLHLVDVIAGDTSEYWTNENVEKIKSKLKHEEISEYYVVFVIYMMEAYTLKYIDVQPMAHYAQGAKLSYDDISLVEAIMRGFVRELYDNPGSIYNRVTMNATVINSHVFKLALGNLQRAMGIVEFQGLRNLQSAKVIGLGLELELSKISQAWKQLKGDEPQSHKTWAQLIEAAAKAESERKAKEENKWVNRVLRSVKAAASRVASQAIRMSKPVSSCLLPAKAEDTKQ